VNPSSPEAPPASDSAPPASPDQRFAYGLRFGSDFALPELSTTSANGSPDVRIELAAPISRAAVEALTAPGAPIEGVLRFDERECQLLFSDVGRFLISEGRTVRVEPLEGTSASSWRLPLLGSVLALLLEQRGSLSLHGGAARFHDNAGREVAAGFLGDKGQGKSTLNAALSQAGFSLLCDDVLAVSGTTSPDESLMALSGFAWLKLSPDALAGVWNAQPDEFALVAPEVAEADKRSVPARLAPDALPMRHLFLLATLPDESDEPFILRALSPSQALPALLPHTFAARFGELYLKGARRLAHFRACARLSSECAVWELARKRDLSLLPATVRAVENAIREHPLKERSAS